jgi:hypothetical protein
MKWHGGGTMEATAEGVNEVEGTLNLNPMP